MKDFSVTRIWDRAEHSAFTDLIRFRDKWLCCFRESDVHVKGRDGSLRILESRDGVRWDSAATFALEGYDLRDPHFSMASDGRLMLSTAGRVICNGEYKTLQSFCAFSPDGQIWTSLLATGPVEHWIWRVSWVDGYAYTWAREQNLPGVVRPQPLRLLRSPDGLTWETIAEVSYGNEAAILPCRDGRMIALLRGWNSLIGESEPPYTRWNWTRTGYFTGGPHLIELADGHVIAGARLFRKPVLRAKYKDPVMLLYRVDLTTKTLLPTLELPSGGDCSYPGFVEYGDDLWVSYYSAHEGKCAIYLAQVPLEALNRNLLDGSQAQDYLPFLEQGPVTDFTCLDSQNRRLNPLR